MICYCMVIGGLLLVNDGWGALGLFAMDVFGSVSVVYWGGWVWI